MRHRTSSKIPKKKNALYYCMAFHLNSDLISIGKYFAELNWSVNSILRYSDNHNFDIILFIHSKNIKLCQPFISNLNKMIKIIPFDIPERFIEEKMPWTGAAHKWFPLPVLFEELNYDTVLFLDCDTVAFDDISQLYIKYQSDDTFYTKLETTEQFAVHVQIFEAEYPECPHKPINSGQFMLSKKLYFNKLQDMKLDGFKGLFDCCHEMCLVDPLIWNYKDWWIERENSFMETMNAREDTEYKWHGGGLAGPGDTYLEINRRCIRWVSEQLGATLYLWREAGVHIEEFHPDHVALWYDWAGSNGWNKPLERKNIITDQTTRRQNQYEKWFASVNQSCTINTIIYHMGNSGVPVYMHPNAFNSLWTDNWPKDTKEKIEELWSPCGCLSFEIQKIVKENLWKWF